MDEILLREILLRVAREVQLHGECYLPMHVVGMTTIELAKMLYIATGLRYDVVRMGDKITFSRG